MKRLFILAVLAIASFAVAEPTDYIKISVTDVTTNATEQMASTIAYGELVGSVITPTRVSGEVLGVVVDITGTGNIDIDLRTQSGQAIPISRTIFSIDDLSADKEYDVRNSATTTAGVDFTDETACIYLIDDYVEVAAYDGDTTNLNVSVYLIMADK